jgi:hypothetical protein
MPLIDHSLIEERLLSVTDLVTHFSVVQRYKVKKST